jgi:hypothetical protein
MNLKTLKYTVVFFSCRSNSINTAVCLFSIFCSQFLNLVNETSTEGRLAPGSCTWSIWSWQREQCVTNINGDQGRRDLQYFTWLNTNIKKI